MSEALVALEEGKTICNTKSFSTKFYKIVEFEGSKFFKSWYGGDKKKFELSESILLYMNETLEVMEET